MAELAKMEQMIAAGNDSASLRFAAGSACFREGLHERAIEHLRRAVELDAGYSAAWKVYARSLDAAGRREEAIDAYTRGIEIAGQKGDRQAAREMNVFLRRLRGG